MSKNQSQNTDYVNHTLSNAVAAGIILALLVGSVNGLLKLARWNDPRYPIYQEVGEWFKKNTPANASLGTLEVGIIGFYSDRPVVGFAGLIQPDVANQLNSKSTYADSAGWAVENFRPDYLVLKSGDFPHLENGYANQYCHVVNQFSGTDYGYRGDIDIYSCSLK